MSRRGCAVRLALWQSATRFECYDSVHLAAFLAVARAAGKNAMEFSCFDDRLRRRHDPVAKFVPDTQPLPLGGPFSPKRKNAF